MIEDKKKAKKIVFKILKRLKLTPCGSINKALNDPTVRAYLSVVLDQKGRKYFLKVRVQDLETEKKFFWKSCLLGKILNENPKLSFNKKTPKLIIAWQKTLAVMPGRNAKSDYTLPRREREKLESVGFSARAHVNLKRKPRLFKPGKFIKASFGEDIDYLLYELVKGKDLGTRSFYDVIRMKMSEIDEVLYILKTLREIPAQSFPKNYDRRGTAFFLERFAGCRILGIEKFVGKNGVENLGKICRLPLFDKYLKFFSHGDFKPNNFIRTKRGIFVVDFEVSSISNQFFDFFAIWGYAIRKPRWRHALMERFLKEYKFKNKEEKVLFEAEKVLFLMFELGSLLWYFKRNLSKIGIRVAKRYLPVRVNELKESLKDFKL